MTSSSEACDAWVTAEWANFRSATHRHVRQQLRELMSPASVWCGDDLAAMALVASLIEQAERYLPHFVFELGWQPDRSSLREIVTDAWAALTSN
jgi:hypothetical protein